ncbi:MAG: response regulator [Bacteroidia bacterium]
MRTILICDDDLFIMQAARELLEKVGYNVETFDSCDFLMEKVEKMQPDLILMDLLIPPMGGDNSIKLLKNDPMTKHIPVLVFSGDPEIEKIYSDTDADGYIRKPFDIDEFQSYIERVLSLPGRPVI